MLNLPKLTGLLHGGASAMPSNWITWAGKVNVTESANSSLTKSGGANAWDAGAYSVEQATSGQTIRIETRNSRQLVRMIGISNVTDAQSDSSYETIDYAIFPHINGAVYCCENGVITSLGGGGTLALNDILWVELNSSGDIVYGFNSTTLRTVTAAILTYPLCADCSLAGYDVPSGSFAELADCKIFIS